MKAGPSNIHANGLLRTGPGPGGGGRFVRFEGFCGFFLLFFSLKTSSEGYIILETGPHKRGL